MGSERSPGALTGPPNRGKPAALADVFRSSRNVLTPHRPEDYPGRLVVVPGPRWEVSVICLQEGESFVARGGERIYAYETTDGARADGFVLDPGDRATLAATKLPHGLHEWRIERVGG